MNKQQILFELEKMNIKPTQYNILRYALEHEYMSAYQMQQLLCSSSADRIMRFIRKDIDSEYPRKYEVVARKKRVQGYAPCDEYAIIPVNSQLRLI